MQRAPTAPNERGSGVHRTPVRGPGQPGPPLAGLGVWLAAVIALSCRATAPIDAPRPTESPLASTATAEADSRHAAALAQLRTAVAAQASGDAEGAVAAAQTARALATAEPSLARNAQDFLTRVPANATAAAEQAERVQRSTASSTPTPSPDDLFALAGYDAAMRPRWARLEEEAGRLQQLARSAATNPAVATTRGWRGDVAQVQASLDTITREMQAYAPVPLQIGTFHTRFVAEGHELMQIDDDLVRAGENAEVSTMRETAGRINDAMLSLQGTRLQYQKVANEAIVFICC